MKQFNVNQFDVNKFYEENPDSKIVIIKKRSPSRFFLIKDLEWINAHKMK